MRGRVCRPSEHEALKADLARLAIETVHLGWQPTIDGPPLELRNCLRNDCRSTLGIEHRGGDRG